MSSNISLRLSPNPGPFTAHTLMFPLILLTDKPLIALSPNSSPIISNGILACVVLSKIGISSPNLSILSLVISI